MLLSILRVSHFLMLTRLIWMTSAVAGEKRPEVLLQNPYGVVVQQILLTPCSENHNTLTRLILDYIGNTPRLSTKHPYKVYEHENELRQFSVETATERALLATLQKKLTDPFRYSISYIHTIDKDGEATVFVTHARGDEQNEGYVSYMSESPHDRISHINYFTKDKLPPYAILRTKQQDRTERVKRIFGELPKNTDASFFSQLGLVVAHNEKYIKFWQTTTDHKALEDTLTQHLSPFLSEPPKQE